MESCLLLILLLLPFHGAFSSPYYSDWQSFHRYVADYNKPYINDSTQMNARYQHFQESLLRHARLNKFESSNGGTAKYGVNKFSDLSPDEFKKMYFSSSISSNLKKTLTANIDDFIQTYAITNVTQFDWRSKDVLTSIKNQERCGSCWAFSVVESIESRLAIQYNQPPLDLSEQQLISCSSTSYDLYGCSGGVLPNAFSFLKNEDVTLVTAALYPFVSGDGKTEACKMNFLHSKGVRLLNYSYYSQIKENIMMDNIIKYGPTSNSVDAAMWQDYLSGIIQHHCTDDPTDHAVQVVGFDMTGPVKYWIVRNTWGSDWGENGYVRLKFGENTCGIADEVISVIDVKSV